MQLPVFKLEISNQECKSSESKDSEATSSLRYGNAVQESSFLSCFHLRVERIVPAIREDATCDVPNTQGKGCVGEIEASMQTGLPLPLIQRNSFRQVDKLLLSKLPLMTRHPYLWKKVE